jgi:hypothetical protein
MLFDTDIVVLVLRGNEPAAQLIDRAAERAVSVITYMELLQGARNKQESKVIKDFLTNFDFQMLPLTENIGHRAAIYMEEYGLKTGICMGDALVAAAAVEYNLVLCTANRKHFQPIHEVEIKGFNPRG